VSQIRNEKVCSAVADLRFCGLPVANSQHCQSAPLNPPLAMPKSVMSSGAMKSAKLLRKSAGIWQC